MLYINKTILIQKSKNSLRVQITFAGHMQPTGHEYETLAVGRLISLIQLISLDRPTAGGPLLFCIHQVNRVNSRNGCAMMTAP